MTDEGFERITAPDGVETPSPAPAPKEPRQPLSAAATLRLAIVLYIAVTIGYGLPMLVWPNLLWDTIAGASGDELAGLVSVRWAGGVLVGLGIAAFLVLAKPKGQRSFVSGMTFHTSLAAAAILVSSINGELDVVDAWFRWASFIVVAVLAVYLWLARWRARDLLKVD